MLVWCSFWCVWSSLVCRHCRNFVFLLTTVEYYSWGKVFGQTRPNTRTFNPLSSSVRRERNSSRRPTNGETEGKQVLKGSFVCGFVNCFCLFHIRSMSSDSNTSSFPPRSSGTNDLGAKEALIIGAALMAMLIFLAFLRYTCNFFIDIFILDEMERIRRNLAEAFRSLCPRWHVRTNPAESNPTTTSPTTNGPNGETSVSRAIARKSKTLTQTDLLEHKARYHHHNRGHSSGGTTLEDTVESSIASYTIICSICLQKLFQGDVVFVGNCDHMFHKDCMVQWMECKGRDCPNCRSEIFPSAAVQVDMGDSPPSSHR